MRMPRLLADDAAVYHVMSRVVDLNDDAAYLSLDRSGAFLFGVSYGNGRLKGSLRYGFLSTKSCNPSRQTISQKRR